MLDCSGIFAAKNILSACFYVLLLAKELQLNLQSFFPRLDNFSITVCWCDQKLG